MDFFSLLSLATRANHAASRPGGPPKFVSGPLSAWTFWGMIAATLTFACVFGYVIVSGLAS